MTTMVSVQVGSKPMSFPRRRTRPVLKWDSKAVMGSVHLLDLEDEHALFELEELEISPNAETERSAVARMVDFDALHAPKWPEGEGTGLVALNIRVQPALLERLQAMAWQERLSLSELARALLWEELRKFSFRRAETDEPEEGGGE